MKKITSLLLILALMPSAFGQNTAVVPDSLRTDLTHGNLDVQLIQHFGLTNRSSSAFVNQGLPESSFTELRCVYNVKMTRSNYGLFGDVGLALVPGCSLKSVDLNSFPMPESGTSYFLRGNVSESGSSSAQVSLKMAIGAYKRFLINDVLSISPYVGIGIMTTTQRRFKMLLKESGSNNQYEAVYAWNCQDINDPEYSPSQYFLTGRIKMSYALSKKASLILGIEYSHFLNSMDYYQKFTNSFNANIWTDQKIKGNNINTLGVSLGIEFL